MFLSFRYLLVGEKINAEGIAFLRGLRYKSARNGHRLIARKKEHGMVAFETVDGDGERRVGAGHNARYIDILIRRVSGLQSL